MNPDSQHCSRWISDNDLELVSPPAHVGGGTIADWVSPKNTLDVGNGRWVGARGVIGILGWITLVVNVESLAACVGAAVIGAAKNVVRVEGLESHVTGLRSRSCKVGKGLAVSVRSGGFSCVLAKLWVTEEGSWCVWVAACC